MAHRIPEPDPAAPEIQDWMLLLSKQTKQMGGMQLAALSEMSTMEEPVVLAGSRFEINGSYFEVSIDEEIAWWERITIDSVCYVYAVPNHETEPANASFAYSSEAPEYQPAKGGWFDGPNRALFRLYKDSGGKWLNKQEMVKPLVIPVYYGDPENPVPGQIWLRGDLLG